MRLLRKLFSRRHLIKESKWKSKKIYMEKKVYVTNLIMATVELDETNHVILMHMVTYDQLDAVLHTIPLPHMYRVPFQKRLGYFFDNHTVTIHLCFQENHLLTI